MPDYTEKWKSQNPIVTTMVDDDEGGPADRNFIIKRTNPIYKIRNKQISVNLLALKGGQSYIDKRLSRHAAETSINWGGGTRADGTKVTGRKDQAHCIPHLGRIVNKLNQYVFGVQPIRDGIDPNFNLNVSRNGVSLNEFMKDVNGFVTSGGWVWIGIDMPEIPQPKQVSIKQKEDEAIRPYWNCYTAPEVVDWAFDSRGRLLWLLIEGAGSVGNDPFAKREKVCYRMLWQPGMATKIIIEKKSRKVKEMIEFPLNIDEVPFVLVGKISPHAITWDSLEQINRTIMDLESASRENLFKVCYPQLHMPKSVIKSAEETMNISQKEAMKLIMGFRYPILLGEGDSPPGYISPDASVFTSLRSEITDLKQELFDTVGFMLRKQTGSVESAESKAWDHLDVKQVLVDNAAMLEEAEKEAVRISKKWDSNFSEYEPKYNRAFDVSNFAEDINALVTSGQVAQPDELKKLTLQKLFHIIRRIGGVAVDDEQAKEIMDAIDSFAETGEFVPAIDDGVV